MYLVATLEYKLEPGHPHRLSIAHIYHAAEKRKLFGHNGRI